MVTGSRQTIEGSLGKGRKSGQIRKRCWVLSEKGPEVRHKMKVGLKRTIGLRYVDRYTSITVPAKLHQLIPLMRIIKDYSLKN